MKIIITIDIDENGVIKNVETKHVTNEEIIDAHLSDYARVFDESSFLWSKSPEYNLTALKQQEHYANDKLRAVGHLFLNDVYDMLGLPRTKAGQVVGWVCDEAKLKNVSFGIYSDHNNNFVNGYERNCILDFNVDGNILDYLE